MHTNLTHQSHTPIPHTLISYTSIPHIDIAASHHSSYPLPQDVADSGYYLVQRVHCFVLAIEGYSITEIEKKTDISEYSQRVI